MFFLYLFLVFIAALIVIEVIVQRKLNSPKKLSLCRKTDILN